MIFDDKKGEKAIVKARFYRDQSFIEWQVELNPVSNDDSVSRDITVNWKLYNDFKMGKKFWTDSNGKEMEERNIEKMPRKDREIAGNYYPVTSTIAVRDQ